MSLIAEFFKSAIRKNHFAQDSFSRADNPTNPGVLESGQQWSVLSGTWGISLGKTCQSPNDGTHWPVMIVDCGSAGNGTVSAVILCSSDDGGGLDFRVIDDNTRLCAIIDSAAIYLYKRNNPAWSLLYTESHPGVFQNGVPHTMTLSIHNRDIVFTADAITVNFTLSVEDYAIFGPTLGKYGVHTHLGVTSFDDFYVDILP